MTIEHVPMNLLIGLVFGLLAYTFGNPMWFFLSGAFLARVMSFFEVLYLQERNRDEH